MIKNTYSTDLKGLPSLAKKVAKRLRGGEILALNGDLGSGKTAFVRALAKLLKIRGMVTSPTFVLMNVFPARLPTNRKPIILFHLDLYRIKKISDVKALGLTQLWGQKNTVSVIEWADKIKKHLPKNTWRINFFHEKST